MDIVGLHARREKQIWLDVTVAISSALQSARLQGQTEMVIYGCQHMKVCVYVCMCVCLYHILHILI